MFAGDTSERDQGAVVLRGSLDWVVPPPVIFLVAVFVVVVSVPRILRISAVLRWEAPSGRCPDCAWAAKAFCVEVPRAAGDARCAS